ncbi:MFS transporter [Streptomyces abyssomicinicus]|uniref:MFS transporter n=1 Tax=Streptomyces abyssomicinicus TaxID=574929 RepID=UPI00125024C9|nr:MFS transporter [Streptomyces abyssomicinicus]
MTDGSPARAAGVERAGPHTPPPDPPGGGRAVAVWSVGVSVYFVAVLFRTSLGVSGLDAVERFHVSASALSTFSMLQLLVYAGMQIPVGLLLDRFGTKRVLVVGCVLFTLGQLGFALAPSYGMALVSRALLGCGDALTFLSVLRLGARWFPARRGPLIGQLAGLIGQGGNVVSTLVLSRALTQFGWTASFVGSALCGVVVLVLTLLFLKDHPDGYGTERTGHRGARYVRHQITESWREPGTRLGMWTHFTTQFPAMVFLLLWGMPFLVEDQGMDRARAGTLLTLIVLVNMVVGVLYGQLVARRHGARMPIALGTVGATAVVWAVLLAWPGRAPLAVFALLCLVLGACGPASMIGFDFSRPANPAERQGTASGITNIGGFTASMTTLLAIGVLLDLTGDDYRVAFGVVFVVQALGVSQMLRLGRAAARRERERLTAGRVAVVHKP